MFNKHNEERGLVESDTQMEYRRQKVQENQADRFCEFIAWGGTLGTRIRVVKS